jgi:hypothetical protein
MASIVEEYESEFRPFYDVAEAGKTAVWEFSQMFGEEDSDSDSGDESDDGTSEKNGDVLFLRVRTAFKMARMPLEIPHLVALLGIHTACAA